MAGRARRGFTMVEMVVVVAVIAVLTAIAAPLFLSQQPDQALKESASDVAAGVRFARSLAVNGGTISGVQSPDYVEIMFDTAAQTYTVQAGEGNNAPVIIRVKQFADYHPGTVTMTATQPSIRFQRNGAANRFVTLTLTQALTTHTKTVEITRAGLARVQ